MKPKQLFLLAAFFVVAAVVTLLVPVHPWFNQLQGFAVLSGFALLMAISGVVQMLSRKSAD
jgi:predicted phage tail protein